MSRGCSRLLSSSGRAALIWLGASLALAQHASAQTLWTHFARNESRNSRTSSADDGAQVAPAHLAAPLWTCSVDDAARPITFNGQSGPVGDRERVYALGKSGGVSRVGRVFSGASEVFVSALEDMVNLRNSTGLFLKEIA